MLFRSIKAGVKAATSYVNDFETTAIKMAKQNECHGVICGHIHQPANIHTNDGHYLNTGDWIENLTALEYNHEGWNIYHYNPEDFKTQEKINYSKKNTVPDVESMVIDMYINSLVLPS